MVVIAALKRWWKRFDAVGRDIMVDASPIFGSGALERKMLEEAERQKKAKERQNNG